MSPDTKTVLQYVLGIAIMAVAVLVLYLLFSSKALSQPYMFESQAKLQSSTYSAGVLTIKVTIPSSEATMIQKGMGKADAQTAVTQIGQQAADDVKRLSERMYHKQRDDARDFIPQSAIDAALTARKAYEAEQKRLADSVAAAQTQGMILPDTDMGVPLYSGIGKSYSPRQDFMEEGGTVPDHPRTMYYNNKADRDSIAIAAFSVIAIMLFILLR